MRPLIEKDGGPLTDAVENSGINKKPTAEGAVDPSQSIAERNAATGNGLLGVARLFVKNAVTGVNAGAAYNLHQQGDSSVPDIITIP